MNEQRGPRVYNVTIETCDFCGLPDVTAQSPQAQTWNAITGYSRRPCICHRCAVAAVDAMTTRITNLATPPRCGKVLPRHFPSAGLSCTRHRDHDIGPNATAHEVKSFDGQTVMLSTAPGVETRLHAPVSSD